MLRCEQLCDSQCLLDVAARHGDDDAGVSQVETREDEEQSVKLAEILELLLAAGYFRARIKGLSPFDKVHQW